MSANRVLFVIGHWTAGGYNPYKQDLDSYQLLIDGSGNKHVGKPVGESCSTGGMNSITYNISCCGGLDRTPIRRVQIEAFYKACAEILKEYGLTEKNFYTHAEIGEMCRTRDIIKLLPMNKWLFQNIGKIDLTVLPDKRGNAFQTGDFIRNKILWYMNKMR